MSPLRTLFALSVGFCLSLFSNVCATPTKVLLYEDDFSDDLSQWRVEQMPQGTAEVEDGKLVIVDAKGCTVWFQEKLNGPTMIEFEATLIDQGGKRDRVSDLNCFWMAQDPKNPADIFANKKRGGSFKNYHSLRLYYVGYGANNNTTTRFRRYPGDGTREVLPEHDLRDKKFMNVANKTITIQIIADGSTIQYLRDGEIVFDYVDENPFTEGWFGFRTVRNHIQFDNFKVYRLEDTQKKITQNVGSENLNEIEAYSGWKCHVISADPNDDGPDGINFHDWDGDGDIDLFVNYEEGAYSRLFFNPGSADIRSSWSDYIEFRHGKCEDSGIGDLDNDGDIDYVANGGWVYFNPGTSEVRGPQAWKRMTLFNREERVPKVADIDGDGLNDLLVGAHRWFKQPAENKHDASEWREYKIGKNKWAMTSILNDLDHDGDEDLIVADRGVNVCWYVNPGAGKHAAIWERRVLHRHTEPMFMKVFDIDSDGLDDLIIAGGQKGEWSHKLIVLLRKNKGADPKFTEIVIDQPSGLFPKGIGILEIDGDLTKNEIVVIPKSGDIWAANYSGDPEKPKNWRARPIDVPGAKSRKKMDNAYLADLDGDGDIDVATTEENGGWGVIWFENPLM
ncbi:MAG: DUF6250 domain-containing protein [Opitutales bacterium]